MSSFHVWLILCHHDRGHFARLMKLLGSCQDPSNYSLLKHLLRHHAGQLSLFPVVYLVSPLFVRVSLGAQAVLQSFFHQLELLCIGKFSSLTLCWHYSVVRGVWVGCWDRPTDSKRNEQRAGRDLSGNSVYEWSVLQKSLSPSGLMTCALPLTLSTVGTEFMRILLHYMFHHFISCILTGLLYLKT